jgi:phenylalanyl-tRNA synthetase beta chain
MKFSEQWLREWVDPPVSTEALVEQLTMAGLEVDSVEPAGAASADVVVGEVLSVESHPDADKLHVCSVEAGQERPLQIVCGAPNVSAGGKYPLALVGACLPGDLKISKSKLRGVESHGMLCSARELGMGDDHQGLLELPEEAVTGTGLQDLLGLDDCMIEVDLTPNRGDCLGIEGIAREVGALTRCPVTSIAIDPVAEVVPDRFDIDVQAPEACPRYLGRVIRGIDPGATTPLWMQERLRRSGLRSIDPVVDVTNYVLLELGQPMHAFDLDRLSSGVCVRYAREGEELTLLDERCVSLDSDTLVIADHEKSLAIAGVMGGIDSGISEKTTDLFLECAWFSPEVIAGRARQYAMHTDSSHRFERGVDFELQHRAMQRATRLLQDITGGQAGPVIEVVAATQLPGRDPITLRNARIGRVLGMVPDADEVTDILERLGMKVEPAGENWQVSPPSFRFDIAIEADLVEEIGRVYGYDRLPSCPLTGALEMQAAPESALSIDRLTEALVDRGYQEAITYSFVDPALQSVLNPGCRPVALANPISSEMAAMRTSLWPGLLTALQQNRKRQVSRVRLFEHGLRFRSQDDEIIQDYVIGGVLAGDRYPEHWDGKSKPVDFYDVRSHVEMLVSLSGQTPQCRFVHGSHPALHPGQTAAIELNGRDAGWLGRIHPAIAGSRDLDPDTFLFELEYDALKNAAPVQFQEISRYPSIRRDLAVVVDSELLAGDLQTAVTGLAGDLLRGMVIFDVYQGKGIETGRKSIAFGLILQDSSRTLTDEDVETVVTRVTDGLREKFGAQLRE